MLSILVVVLTSFLGARTFAQPSGSGHSVPAFLGTLLARDDTDGTAELSFIRKLAAVGDSYSAGIGAGNLLQTGSIFDDGSDFACRRYDHSYPYLVNQDARLGDPASRVFQFKSCSGAVIDGVINKQLPTIDGGQQVILLSAGGNDCKLVDILNQCVFQFSAIQSAALDKAKSLASKYDWAKTIDWDALVIGCDGQMAAAQNFINGPVFSSRLDMVIAAAKEKLASDGVIYYTGYAKFWAEDLSTACDKVSWSIWFNSAADTFQLAQYLTADHRRTMNSLVDAVNNKIEDAVARAGPQVQFVDYDKYFGSTHGRFCEAGVDESMIESDTRPGLMFYELNTWDPFGGSPWKRDAQEPANGTVEADHNILAQITLLLDEQARLRHTGGQASPSTNPQDKSFTIPNLLPDGYGRVFHPQILGHQTIAGLIIYNMEQRWLREEGVTEAEDYHFDRCSYTPPDPNAPSLSAAQTIAIASYINPTADPGAWDKLISYNNNKVSVLVANVLNGPDSKVNSAWKGVIDRAHSAGKKVIGYVRTGYLGLSDQKFTTRLGSLDLADWIAQIEEDVQMWHRLYGDSIDGIFFDEGWPECGLAGDNRYADAYAFINRMVKKSFPGYFTVLNPGSPMARCYDATMDTLLTFESSYEQYTQHYVPNDWTPKDPRKIWHIIYNVPQDQIASVAALAKQRGAGLVEINNNVMPNPYDKLPSDDYMNAFMNAIEGGSPRIQTADTYPTTGLQEFNTGVQEVRHDYSSVTVQWAASNGANGYQMYSQQDGGEMSVVELPKDFRQATAGGFDPNGPSGVTVSVRAIDHDGQQSPTIGELKTNLTPLPGGHTIANLQHAVTDSTAVFEADVLVPYAFVRMYLCCLNTTCALEKPAWTIQWNAGHAAYCRYMVEGQNFFNYIGSNGAWSWSPVSGGVMTNSGYHYKWSWPVTAANEVLPGGLAYIIQGEGYNQLTNIWYPCTYMTSGDHIQEVPYAGTWCSEGRFS